ncbi:MAG: hypothetical protein MJ102_04635 [Clostridia bacterium]|nr:hypothetical protein [Clostridia bacterium]
MKKTKKSKLFLRASVTLLAVLMLLPSCTGGSGNVDDTGDETAAEENTGESSADSGNVIFDGKSEYRIVRSDNIRSSIVKDNVAKFNKAIKTATGVLLSVTTDWVKPNDPPVTAEDCEILIGDVERSETAAVKAELPENGYAVKRMGNKIIILGADENLTAVAMLEFMERILGDKDHCGEGFLRFADTDSITGTVDCEGKMTLAYMLDKKYNVAAESKQVFQCEPQGECNICQGAATDGEHAFFVLRNSDDTKTVICKYTLADGKLVKVSGLLPLGHGSDMTYNPDKNFLVVAHGNDQGKILTFVNPETLELIENKNISKGAGAISYNPVLKKYAIGQAGKSLHILNTSLSVMNSVDRTQKDNAIADGYITQGMGSDEKYIYFPMNLTGNKENVIVVYDWNGKYITRIKLEVAMESESMFVTPGEEYYVSFYKNKQGALLHKVTFLISIG